MTFQHRTFARTEETVMSILLAETEQSCTVEFFQQISVDTFSLFCFVCFFFMRICMRKTAVIWESFCHLQANTTKYFIGALKTTPFGVCTQFRII